MVGGRRGARGGAWRSGDAAARRGRAAFRVPQVTPVFARRMRLAASRRASHVASFHSCCKQHSAMPVAAVRIPNPWAARGRPGAHAPRYWLQHHACWWRRASVGGSAQRRCQCAQCRADACPFRRDKQSSGAAAQGAAAAQAAAAAACSTGGRQKNEPNKKKHMRFVLVSPPPAAAGASCSAPPLATPSAQWHLRRARPFSSSPFSCFSLTQLLRR